MGNLDRPPRVRPFDMGMRMNIQEARAKLPHLEGLDDQQVVDAIHMAYYPDLPRDQIAKSLGVEPPPPPPVPRTFMGTVADTGISALKGAIAVPEAAVGLADMATGGEVGKTLEGVGFRPGEAKKILDEQYSPAQKAANEQVQKAEGLWNTFKAAVKNPSVVAHSVVESLPLMGAGGVLGRGMMMAGAGRIGAGMAGALGEGTAAAGSAASQIRQESPDRLLTGDQPGLALATGAAVSLFGMGGAAVAGGAPGIGKIVSDMGLPKLGARIAKGLGIADVDTMLAGAAVNPRVAKGITRQLLEGAVSEGFLEELPQSVVEQVLQNIALDRPLDEGVSQAAVLGTLSGALMGGGANVYNAMRKEPEKKPADIVAAPTVDAAIDAFNKSVKMPEMPGGVDAGQAGAAARMMEQSLTGTDRASLLGAPVLGQDANASMLTAARANLEDRRQDMLGNQTVDRMTAEANAELQGLRQFEPRVLPELDAIIQAGDRTGPAGVPLTQQQADRTATAIGGITIPVNGGFIVRPKKSQGATREEDARAPVDQPPVAAAAPTAATGQGAPAPGLPATGSMPAGAAVAPRGGDDRLDAAAGSVPAASDRGVAPGDVGAQAGAREIPAAVGGERRPDADGSAGAVDRWEAFPPEMRSMNVPRAEMPQIKAEHRGAMVNFLNARGIEHGEELDVDAASLRPTQAEYNPAKVQQAREFTGGNRAILVSADNRILDGHHQWAQALQDGQPIRIIRLKAPITQLLKTVKEFPSATIDTASATGAAPAPAPAAPDGGPAPQGGEVRDEPAADGAGRADDVQPGDAQPSPVAARWDRMTPGERRVLLTTSTKAKGKAIDRVSEQPFDALEPGWQKTVMRVMPADETAAPAPTTAPAEDRKDKAGIREKLEAVAKRLGVFVFKAASGWHASGNMVTIPDADVDSQNMVEPMRVFAHELGHVIIKKRGLTFSGFPKTEMLKWVSNYDELVAASKDFRPEVHKSENDRFRRHAAKPEEVIADAIGAVLMEKQPMSLLGPLREKFGITDSDMGLTEATQATDPVAEAAEDPGKAPLPITEEQFAQVLDEHMGRNEEDPYDDLMQPAAQMKDADRTSTEVLTPEQAKLRLERWKAHALAQGKSGRNNGKTVLSLFDASGVWSQPWRDAGYNVLQFDIQNGDDINDFSAEFLTEELDISDVYAILAAPPCTDFSSSGAHAWAKKDADGRTDASVKLVMQTLRTVDMFRPSVWALENPVGRIAKLTGLPRPTLAFQPHNYGDPYTKRTMLWGSFEPDLPQANVLPTEGSKITKMSGYDKFGRSLTPEGFAYAFFMANNAQDLGVAKTIAREFRGVDEKLVQQALDAGMSERDVFDLVADDGNDRAIDSANKVLRDAIKERKPKATSAPAPTATPAPSAATKTKPKPEPKRTSDAREAEAARAAYFTPGNIVRSYYGFDEVLEYRAPTQEGGEWSVKVHEVQELDGKWVRVGKPQDARVHSTQPSADQLSDGPHAKVSPAAGPDVPYTSPRADGQPFTNAPARGVEKARKAGARAEGQNDELDAEMQGYEDRAGIEGWWGVGGARGQKDALLAPGRVQALQAIGVSNQRAGYGKDGDLTKVLWNYLPDDIKEKLVALRKAGWTPKEADAPAAPTPTAAPKPDPLTEQEKAAKAKMLNAAAKLAQLLSKNTRASITPEQEQAMLPIVIELFEGAMELGYVKFKQAARHVRQFITQAIDADAADSIPLDTLQGAYIAVARRHQDKDITPKGEVVMTEMEDVLAEDAVPPDTNTAGEADNGGQDGTAARNVDRDVEGTPGGAPAQDVRAPAEGGQAGRAPGEGGGRRQQGAGAADRAGDAVPGGMGAGEGASVPGARAGRGTGNAGKRGVQSPPRADAGPGLFDDARREGSDELSPTAPPAPAPQFKLEDFTIEDDLGLGEGGEKTKFRNNVAAIRVAKQLMEDAASLGGPRMATPEEQAVLAKYVGWGGLASAFDAAKPDWSREFAELKSLLTPDEYEAARRSTRYAHYTSREIIQDGIYAALRRFGFTGGRVLEPGAGVGNFIGLMPHDMRSAGRITAVEREPIAATIARALYPLQNVQLADFTEFKGNDGYYDAVVGNPPFASDPQVDQSGRKHLSGLSLHNYFFAKSVDMLREGGILAQVVTNSFLDAQGDRARRYIGERTKFLGAIRLPNNAFSKNAGTEVTTDIIFLQKRPESEWGSRAAKAEAAAWMEAPKWESATGDEVPLNRYFHDHPEMMLGEFGAFGTMYRKGSTALVARPGQDTKALLIEAVQRLQEGVYKSAAEVGTDDAINAAVVALKNPPVEEGGYFLEGGKLIRRLPDVAGEARGTEVTAETQWTAKTALGVDGFDKLRRLAEMRGTLRKLLAAELADDSAMTGLRALLNQQYDEFVKQHHRLGDRGTYRVFDDDPDLPLILSLEDNYTPGIGPAEAKKLNIKPSKSTAQKAAIFSRRVVDPRKRVQRVETPADAVAVSMAERGRLDTAYIAELLKRPAEDVLREMTEGDSPLLFLDPATDEYVLRDAYLSGNVRQKLQQAKSAGMTGNVAALEKVQPEDVPAHEISAKLGAPWVPTKVYEDFAVELLGEGTKANVQYQKLNSSYSTYITPGSEVNNSNRWGTPRYSATELLSALLNNRTIQVKDPGGRGEAPKVNAEETEKANVKAQEIRDRFSDWLFSDPDRSELLVRAYNDTNNNYVTRNYDGSWLTFPGKVPDLSPDNPQGITFRRHQRNAIARIIQDRTTLLDHVVGAGKTFTVIAAAMELRRTGLAKKPMITVPNHLVKQWAADFYRLYPGANILTATKKDFAGPNRRRFLARIATGDWDAVIIAHSTFGYIQPGAKFEAEFNAKQVRLIQEALKDVEESDATAEQKKRTVKQLEGLIERLENRIKALRNKPMDNLLDFDELGVDQLFVDEAHLFKNLLYTTKLQGVAGLGDPAGSKRAYDMYVKTQEVMAKNGRGQGVVFATGTPVSNSLAEKFHMMRYLMPRQMDELGFQSFDAWANTYAEVTQVWMQKPSGDGFKAQNRMSTFSNVHELLKLFDQVADTVTNDDIKKAYREENNGDEYPLPPIKTGRRIPVSLDKTAAQEAYMEQLVQRAKVLEARKGPPKKGDDNILVLMTDARKAAMDIRLVDVDRTEREPGGRVDKAAENIAARYQQWNAQKGTQLVFADLGTPIKHAQSEMKEYQALQGIIAEATEEVMDRAALGDERAQDIVDAAEDAAKELEEKGPDWLTAVKAALRGFSVYDDLKAALVERGIPENEIAFIHDYNTDEQKAALFRRVNAGDIRVLVGSTQKMGAGTNVQQRLVALHHLDVPWRPSDVEQREGRIVRQGNILYENRRDRSTEVPGFEVEILAYVTKDTLDMRMWQIQEVKLKVINQLRTRQIERNMDNAFEDAEMSASEMQAAATGNMDLLREIQARNDIKKLEQKRRSFEAQKNDLIARRRRNQRDLETLPAQIEEAREARNLSQQYVKAIEDRRAAFSVEIDGRTYTDRKQAGDYLQSLYDSKIFTRTVEKGGKKVREEMSDQEHDKLRAELAGLRDAGIADDDPKVQALVEKLLGFEEKAAPLDVTVNGVNFTARAKMIEAWRTIAGDTDGFTWTFKDKDYTRRTEAVLAAKSDVADSMADQKQVSLGRFGPFELSIEGQPATGRREEKELSVDAVLMAKGKAVSDNVFTFPADVEATKVAERVLDWAHARAMNAGVDLSWLESSLRSAQKTAQELAKAEDLKEWPDQEKLEAARAKHKEILARLGNSNAAGAGAGSGAGRVMQHSITGEMVTVLRGPYKQDDATLVFVKRADGTQEEILWAVLAKDGKTAFSQGEDDAAGRRTVAELQQMVDTITSEWARTLPVTVVRSVLSPAVPMAVKREAADRLRAGGKTPRGVFYDGQVWLFADGIGSPQQAAEVLFHEVLGHYGMRGHFGREFDTHLDRVQLMRKSDVDAMLVRMGVKDTPENRRRAAEEVLAYIAQTKPELGLVQRAIALIRNWLRDNLPGVFGDIELTDADLIQKFILPARRFVEGPGGPGGGMEMQPAFATQANPFYSALSKAVEAVPAKAQPAAGWLGAIQAQINKGAVKADEVEWSGVREWLDLQQGKVTKQQVLDYLGANGVQVKEVTLGTSDTSGERETLKRYGLTVEVNPEDPGAVGFFNSDMDIMTADEVRMEFGDEAGAAARRIEGLMLGNESNPKYATYQLPGGQNYREMLLTLPGGAEKTFNQWLEEKGIDPIADAEPALREQWKAELQRAGSTQYRSNHWDQPNVLAHIRLNDRTDADGKRVLFVEELQSDWAQDGRKKGFRTEEAPEVAELRKKRMAAIERMEAGDKDAMYEVPRINAQLAELGAAVRTRDDVAGFVPRAPFIDSTDKWLTLALKRVMVMAAQEGYDAVAFVNGEQSAERYDLSKQVRSITWTGRGNDTEKSVTITPNSGNDIEFMVQPDGAVGSMSGRSIGNEFDGKRLDEIVGKDVAERIMGEPYGDMRGNGLKVGGQGMIAFYDKIVPAAVNKLLAKVGGGKVEEMAGSADVSQFSVERDKGEFVVARGEEIIAGPFATRSEALKRMREEEGRGGLMPDGQMGFTITPAMREKVAGGMPMFSREPLTEADRKLAAMFAGSDKGFLESRRKSRRAAKAEPDLGALSDDELLGRRTPVTETEAFRRWFGDSVVTDNGKSMSEGGKPLAVYHGTDADFSAFDPARMGSKTDDGAYGRGFYFSPNHGSGMKWAGTAGAYAASDDGGNIMPVYLKIERPLIVPSADYGRVTIDRDKYDGVIVEEATRGQRGPVLEYVVFRPEQIKSAIGNRGTFDPENPDIMFSQGDDAPPLNDRARFRDTARMVLQEIHAAPGKVHWWHKTIGTQYNLAQRSTPFRRVFERVQDFLGDVSKYATEAADKAPSILPKLETWRDMTKTPLSAADTKAISAPIFEGTLSWTRMDGNPIQVDDLRNLMKVMDANEMADIMVANNKISPNIISAWRGLPMERFQQNVTTAFQDRMLKPGIVWTGDELKRMFKLTDKQVGYYREFRASVDKSITDLSISDMLRTAGKDADAIRADVLQMNDVGAAAQLLRAHFMDLIERQPARQDVLTSAMNKMQNKAARAQDLMDLGYAPLSRFGHYTVTVRRDGQVLYFGMYESRIEAGRAARALSNDPAFAGATFSRGTLNEDDYKLFAGISPETMELFGEMLGMESTGDSEVDRAFQAYIQLAKSNRSAMKRLIHRKGIAGFSEDVGRVLANFVYSNSRLTSKNLHLGEVDRMIRDMQENYPEDGEIRRQAVRLREYINDPTEEAHQLRGLLFAQYLGGSIASMLVNMTQPFQVTLPWLSQFGGVMPAAAQMRDALKVAWAKTTGDARLDAALKRATEEGVVAPQEVHMLMAQAQGSGGLRAGDGTPAGNAMAATGNFLTKLGTAWGKPFATAELFNRRVTFVAAYRTAVQQKMRDPYGFAERAVRETQFIYNKGNKPQWARGAIGSTLFTFKQYSISYLELMQRMWTVGEPGSQERAAGRRAVLFAMGMLLLAGGAGGLPFVEDVEDLVDALAQRLGYNFTSRNKRRELLEEAFGKAFGGFLERGVSGLPGAPIDVSGRLGLGNVIPGTGLLMKKQDHTRDVVEMLGPVGDLATRTLNATDKAASGDLGAASVEISPTAARNAIKAVEMAATGQYRDARGYKVMEVDAADAAAKAIGFQPGDVARVQQADRAAQVMVANARLREAEISAKWAQALVDKDVAAQQEARKMVLDWNEKNPETPIKIRLGDVLKRAKNMQRTRAERIEKSAPKEVRQEARRLMREE